MLFAVWGLWSVYLYLSGEHIPQNHEKAFQWCAKAAIQGSAQSQYNLALFYMKGCGTPKDDKISAFWFENAAYQGCALSQHNLGVFYEEGRGVDIDLKKSAYWYDEAKKQGATQESQELTCNHKSSATENDNSDKGLLN